MDVTIQTVLHLQTINCLSRDAALVNGFSYRGQIRSLAPGQRLLMDVRHRCVRFAS